MKFKYHSNGLGTKIKVARWKGFKLIEIVKFTLKIDSNLSAMNITYYLKHQKPIIHREVFKLISPIPEYVKTHSVDRVNCFHFTCCRWVLYNQTN